MAGSDGNVRIGTTEREEAVRALAEHMSQGRLEIGEYDQRCALVVEARTRAELAAIFEDLPEPNPMLNKPEPEPVVATQPPLVEKHRDNTKLIIGGFVIFAVAAIITVTAILGEWWALIPALLIVAILAMVS